MKKITLLLEFALLCTLGIAQTTEVHREFGQAWGGGAVVDINNDGYLDFYIAGMKNNPKDPIVDLSGNPLDLNRDGIKDSTERWRRLYLFDPQSNTYKYKVTNLASVDRVNMDWRDVNGDGLMDVIIGEHSGISDDSVLYTGTRVRGIFKNIGDGTFERLNWPIAKNTTAAAFADFNMDGLLDYICISKDSGASAIFFNAGNGVFDSTGSAALFGKYKLGLAYVKVVDFNSDGLPDFLLSANVDNVNKAPVGNARVFMDVFLNNPEAPGNFNRALLKDQGVFMKANGYIGFADVNGDGIMDMFVNGEGGEGTGEPTSGDVWACISHLYLGKSDGTLIEKPNNFIRDMRPLGSTGVGGALFDWNNDGNYDLILTGWAPTLNPATQAGVLYTGDGAGNFTNETRVPGASETVLLLLDWNNDGKKDYLVSGHSWDAIFYPNPEDQGRTGAIYQNTSSNINQRPNPPTNLAINYDPTNGILSANWDAATDDRTPSASLTYEYFLKKSNGEYLIAPSSFVGGEKDGLRKVVALGNAFLSKSLKFYDLPSGNYTFGVQAIDASYEGSTFVTADFSLVKDAINNATSAALMIYPNPASKYIKVIASKTAVVNIYNLDGRLEKSVINNEYVDVSNLTPGMYMVTVNENGKRLISRLIVR
ncbi:MAG: T9SS type A sorting domain-containing protein [Bacteroidales bacterium]